MAQAFDERRLELSGAPILVAEACHSYFDTTTVSASENDIWCTRARRDSKLNGSIGRAGSSVGYRNRVIRRAQSIA